MTKRKTQTRSQSSSATAQPLCRTTEYARAVLAGEEIAGPHVRASCKRFLDDLENAHLRGLFFDRNAAERVFRFFETILCLTGGKFEGRPFALHPSQCFILGNVFGWKKEDGNRRFRRCYIEIGKGNGKSPMAAGVGLYGLLADNEPRAEIYAAASKLDQAKIMFRDARDMVQLSPHLDKVLEITGGEHQPNIAHMRSGSWFRPISSDKAQSGTRPHFGLNDEIHEHTSRDTIDMLERGFKGRENPLLWMITNSGFDKTGVCWEEHDHAVKVAHDIIQDDSTFSYVCALDEGDNPLEDSSCWKKANPLLGVTLTEEYIAGVVKQAKTMPGKRNNILRLHFCIWTDADSAWMDGDLWFACEKKLDLEDYAGKKAYLGLDMSYTTDPSALSIVFENEEAEGSYDAFVEFFLPKKDIRKKGEQDNVDYKLWAEGGYLHLTEGAVIRLEYIANRINHLMSMFQVENIAYDRYRLKELEDDLFDMDITAPLVEHPQGFRRVSSSELWMPNSVQKLENLIIEGKLRVKYNPMLRWNVASTVIRNDPAGTDNKIFDKSKSTGRIDGVVALAMGLGIANVKHADGDLEDFLSNPVIG